MIKTILVPVGNANGAEERLELAIDLANQLYVVRFIWTFKSL